MYPVNLLFAAAPPNFAVERTGGSHSLAAAAHRERSTHKAREGSSA